MRGSPSPWSRIASTDGNLAAAVGDSIANRFIFANLDVRRGGAMDPGADRVSATPVEDTCEQFPAVGIVAINVTGESVFYSVNMRCPVLEVQVSVGEAGPAAMDPDDPEFARVVRAGKSRNRKVRLR